MIDIQIEIPWHRNGEYVGTFRKLHKMPALPPIGSQIVLTVDEGELSEITVELYWWKDYWPERFELETSEMDTGDEDEAETIAWMNDNGWLHHSQPDQKKPPTEAPDRVQ